MRPRLAIILLLLVALPVASLTALSWRLAAAERDANAHRIREVTSGILRAAEAELLEFMRLKESRLTALLESLAPESGSARALLRQEPGAEQFFVVSGEGNLAYPTTAQELTRAEQDFLRRSASLWEGKAFYHHARQPVSTDATLTPADQSLVLSNVGVQQQVQQVQQAVPMQQQAAPVQSEQAPAQQQTPAQVGKKISFNPFSNAPMPQTANYVALTGGRSRGWYSWYWDNSLHLAFYEMRPDGTIAGAELNPTRLIADMIALLPATDAAAPNPANARITLADAAGRALYGWGGYAPPADAQPSVVLPLSPPLAGWRLEYTAPPDARSPAASLLQVLGPVLALGAALLLLGAYFYRESTRELREAATRITFVNQVSHELKTPLTNIRMYAELLDGEIDDGTESNGTARRYLHIVTTEIGRLSRLITNILTFSRSQRQKLSVAPTIAEPDEVIAGVLEQFAPSLASAGITTEFVPAAPGAARVDADALGQIVGNLVSNVEKYAAAGGRLGISTRRDGDRIIVTVADSGPGIPRGERQRVFEAFHRVHNRLTDGVAGTGIGLTISRELARLHGGDLALAPSDGGCAFELNIHAPKESHP